jgi:hypothetical protein
MDNLNIAKTAGIEAPLELDEIEALLTGGTEDCFAH